MKLKLSVVFLIASLSMASLAQAASQSLGSGYDKMLSGGLGSDDSDRLGIGLGDGLGTSEGLQFEEQSKSSGLGDDSQLDDSSNLGDGSLGSSGLGNDDPTGLSDSSDGDMDTLGGISSDGI